MAIEITVGTSPDDFGPTEEEPKIPQASMQMNARKTLDGSLAIYDHVDIDIVVIPGKNKVLALAKNEMSDEVYETQSRLFDFLVKKGVVLPESIRGGNVYASMEGLYPASEKGRDHSQVTIFTIGKFLEEEKPYYMWNQAHEDDMEDWWTTPDDEETTEYGEVPQEREKGSMPKDMARHGYRIQESKDD